MQYHIETIEDYTKGCFKAMASPCEILLDTQDQLLARSLIQTVLNETRRIEQKFSRYLQNNIIYRINHSLGQPIEVDEETGHLLDYAQQCYELSEGLFDISSGVLGQVWRFDGGDNIPTEAEIESCLKKVGWHKIEWRNPIIRLPQGMQIDLGGVGKEYAVDRCAQLIKQETHISSLLNFGGDIVVTNPRRDNRGWNIGVEQPETGTPIQQIELKQGAIATSGDTRRYLLIDNKRYSHILNPKTGWPVSGAPRSVTVIANTCTEAGMLATFAMLQGRGAEDFLSRQGGQFWCLR